MPTSKAQQKAVHKYVKANYDRMELTVPKGRKEEIKKYAASNNESVNGFINRAISETIARGGAEKPAAALQGIPGILALPSQDNATQPVSAQIKEHLAKTGEDEAAFFERAAESTIRRDNVSLEMGINPATDKKMKGERANE